MSYIYIVYSGDVAHSQGIFNNVDSVIIMIQL